MKKPKVAFSANAMLSRRREKTKLDAVAKAITLAQNFWAAFDELTGPEGKEISGFILRHPGRAEVPCTRRDAVATALKHPVDMEMTLSEIRAAIAKRPEAGNGSVPTT